MRNLHSLFGELSLALFDQMADPASRRTGRPFSVAVGSARRGEGRSFVAEGLALHAAALGKHNILLVDADLSRPELTTRYKGTGRSGLSDILRGTDMAPALLNTRLPNLFALGAGQVGDANLLYRQEGLSKFLIWVREVADVVILDMPPFQTDAAPVVAAVDRVVLVVDATVTPRQEAQAALARVPDTKSWGVVLNKCAPRSLPAVS